MPGLVSCKVGISFLQRRGWLFAMVELFVSIRVLNQMDYFNSPPPVGGGVPVGWGGRWEKKSLMFLLIGILLFCLPPPPTGALPPGRRRIKIVSLIICFITFQLWIKQVIIAQLKAESLSSYSPGQRPGNWVMFIPAPCKGITAHISFCPYRA